MPVPETKALGHEREVVVSFGSRRYRCGTGKESLLRGPEGQCVGFIRGVRRRRREIRGESIHIDTLDLYQARARTAFVTAAAAELGVAEEVIKGDIGKLLLALESEQEKLITAAHAPKAATTVVIDEPARARAMAWLSGADLTGRIVADFSRCGIVGEGSNALVGYLCAISRKLDRPLALLIQSTSAAGKSSLLDAILRFVPEEDRIVYSAMTGQSLFYMGELDLKHKLLAIAEEQGATRASYA